MWGESILMTESMTSPRPLEAPNPNPHLTILRHGCSLWADLVHSPLCLSFILVSCAYVRFLRLPGSFQMAFSYYRRVVAHVAASDAHP